MEKEFLIAMAISKDNLYQETLKKYLNIGVADLSLVGELAADEVDRKQYLRLIGQRDIGEIERFIITLEKATKEIQLEINRNLSI